VFNRIRYLLHRIACFAAAGSPLIRFASRYAMTVPMRVQSAQCLFWWAFAPAMRYFGAYLALIHDDAGGHRFGAMQHAGCAFSVRT
jgi:hypothetical protein